LPLLAVRCKVLRENVAAAIFRSADLDFRLIIEEKENIHESKIG
jgi:hypothetical protein